jgi:hypothetical protein
MKTLTVGELIKKLERFPKDTPVFHQTDPEGNSFGTIHESSVINMDIKEYNGSKIGVFIFPFDEYLNEEDLFNPITEEEMEEYERKYKQGLPEA